MCNTTPIRFKSCISMCNTTSIRFKASVWCDNVSGNWVGFFFLRLNMEATELKEKDTNPLKNPRTPSSSKKTTPKMLKH